MRRNSMAVYLGLVTAMSFYGLSFIFTKAVLTELPPITILLIRIAVSSVLLHAIHVINSKIRPQDRVRIDPAHYKYFILVALFQPFLYFMAENFGLNLVSPAVASIIIGTIPVVTPVVAAPVLGERVSPLNILGLVISLSGVLVITSNGSAAGTSLPGIALLFCAVLAAAGYAVAVRAVPSRYNAFTIVRMQNLIGIPLVLPFFLLFEMAKLQPISLQSVGHLSFLAIFPSTLSFILLSIGIRRVGASRANAFANLVPVFTAGFAVVLLSEPILPRVWIGMALVIGGVSIAQKQALPRTGIQEA